MRIVNVLVDETIKNHHRFSYTIDFINNHPLVRQLSLQLSPAYTPDTAHEIYYGNNTPTNDSIFFLKLNQLFEKNPKSSLFHISSIRFEGIPYYFLTDDHITQSKKGFDEFLPFDIFESIFFFISRYEEYFSDVDNNDAAGWLEEGHHLLVKHHVNHLPIVDRLIYLLIRKLGYSMNQPASYDLTHDLDIISRFNTPWKLLRSVGASIYHRRGISQIKRDTIQYWSMIKKSTPDPYDVFEEMLDQDSRWSQKVLYIMSGGNSEFDNKYQLNDPKVKKVIDLAINRGYSIGFHPSYNAAMASSMFASEKRVLEVFIGAKVAFSRQHWLRFNWKTTPSIYGGYDNFVDSSMGYNQHIGFRCGTGFAYQMYDFDREEAYLWKEQPMSLMDSSVFHIHEKTDKTISEIITSFIDFNRLNTHITLNFHNSNFDITTPYGQELTHVYQQHILSL